MKQDIRIITPLELVRHAWNKLGQPQSNTKIRRDIESGAIQLNGIKLKPEYKILILDEDQQKVCQSKHRLVVVDENYPN